MSSNRATSPTRGVPITPLRAASPVRVASPSRLVSPRAASPIRTIPDNQTVSPVQSSSPARGVPIMSSSVRAASPIRSSSPGRGTSVASSPIRVASPPRVNNLIRPVSPRAASPVRAILNRPLAPIHVAPLVRPSTTSSALFNLSSSTRPTSPRPSSPVRVVSDRSSSPIRVASPIRPISPRSSSPVRTTSPIRPLTASSTLFSLPGASSSSSQSNTQHTTQGVEKSKTNQDLSSFTHIGGGCEFRLKAPSSKAGMYCNKQVFPGQRACEFHRLVFEKEQTRLQSVSSQSSSLTGSRVQNERLRAFELKVDKISRLAKEKAGSYSSGSASDISLFDTLEAKIDEVARILGL